MKYNFYKPFRKEVFAVSRAFLILCAVLPAAVLMAYIYKKDKLEKESPAILKKLVLFGIVSTLPAIVIEAVGSSVLAAVYETNSLPYAVLMNFLVIAGAEEGSKFFFLKRKSWNAPDFNCQFDGVVYSVFVSLGFALLENIMYVLQYGFSTAVARAVLSVPGHACFGVFMGAFYGMAKRYETGYCPQNCQNCLRRSVLIPMLLHGIYDFIATTNIGGAVFFLVFVIIVFSFGIRLTNKLSKEDRYIDATHWYSI